MKYLRFSDLRPQRQHSDDATAGEYRGWKAKIVRAWMGFMAKLSHIDLYGGFIHRAHLIVNSDNDFNGSKFHAYKPANPQDETIERLRRVRQITWPAWSRLVRLFVLYCTVKMYISYIYQHAYVSYNHELRVLNATRTKLDIANSSEYQNYERLRNNAIVQLKSIGAPYYQAGPICDILLINTPVYIFLYYITPKYIFSLLYPFDISIVRALFDPVAEQANHTNGRIWRHVNEHIKSCADYLKFLVRILGKIYLSLSNDSNHYEVRVLVDKAYERLRSRQELISTKLKEHAIKGHLQPLNRNWRWLNFTANCFIGYLLSVVMVNLIGISLLLFFRANYSWDVDFTGARDILFGIELDLYYLIALLSSFLLLAVQALSVLDLDKYVLALNAKLDSTLRHNDQFISYFQCAENKSPHDSEKEELNMNLVIMLVQVKMFRAEMRAIQPVLSYSATVLLISMNALPLMVKFYAHYMTEEVRMIGINVCSQCYLLFDLIFMPNCYLYSRCLDLYRKLSSLLAHAIEINQTGSEVYDEHTIWLLRKELNWPEKLYDEFRTRTIIIKLTYASFLRLHFWFGIILIVILKSDLSKRKSAYENIFGETLGVF